MSNNLLSEYHVWSVQKGSTETSSLFYVVDTYFQEIVSEHATMRDAFDSVRELRERQKGTYPSIIEAS